MRFGSRAVLLLCCVAAADDTADSVVNSSKEVVNFWLRRRPERRRTTPQSRRRRRAAQDEPMLDRRVRQWADLATPEDAPGPRNATVFATGCCGFGHRLSRLFKAYVYAASRHRQLVVDWGATCAGNLWSALFADVPDELVGSRGDDDTALAYYSPKCPRGKCRSKREWLHRADPTRATAGNHVFSEDALVGNDPPRDWMPPSRTRAQTASIRVLNSAQSQKEWELAFHHSLVAPYATRFASLLIKKLKSRWRLLLEDSLASNFQKRFVVGVHFRLGNGERFARRPQNKTKTVLQAAVAVRQLAASFGYGEGQFRVFVATDDPKALDVLAASAPDLDVFSRPQSRLPRGAGVAFSSWRTKDGDVDEPEAVTDHTAAAAAAAKQEEEEEEASSETCLASSADALLDALLLGYADALLLTVPSTFSVLPKALAAARNAPFCAFLDSEARDRAADDAPYGLSKDIRDKIRRSKVPGLGLTTPSLVLTCLRASDDAALPGLRVAVTKLPVPSIDQVTDALGSTWHSLLS